MFKPKFKPNFLIPLFLCVLVFLTGVLSYGKKTDTIDQTTRLAALAKVWGLLKYYHPEVAKGEIDWDAALISAIPAVKAAEDFDSFNQEIDNLILEAGDVDQSDYNPGVPAHPNESLFKWVKDTSIFDNEVIKKLKTVQKKHEPVENYYVQAAPYVGNTTFENEKPYSAPYYPDENYRLLALFRYWNIIQYFFPYKDDMDRDWEPVLEEFIPRLLEAGYAMEYHLTIKELTTQLNDSHAYTDSPYLYYFFGYYYAPFQVRYIQNQTIVTRVFPELMDPADTVQVGDIILKRNGTDIDTFRNDMRKYVEASNEPALQRNISVYVVRGKSNQLNFTILRGGQVTNVTVPGYFSSVYYGAMNAADNQLEKWKILPGNIGYVHMGILQVEDVDQMMMDLMYTRAIVFDVRNYPLFTVGYISYYLNPTPEEYAKYTIPDLDYPGEFNFTETHKIGEDNPDYYKGRVVLLVDEWTQSHAEWTCMLFQTAPDVTIIGSQTAGADGNVSYFYLPGNIITVFTGIGVYYPDGTPTQRIGIVPDINVRPTIAGIQQGQDEVLQRAIQFIQDN
ncbi:MAG: S41 family peptidase [Candidatus Aminicenantes bacterium]|jgi:hypothetical protein